MASRCLSSICVGGNCQGCRNGSVWCDDPRCYPNCPGCTDNSNNNSTNDKKDWIIALIIGILSLVVLILLVIIWWKAESQPGNQIITRTIHHREPVIKSTLMSRPPAATAYEKEHETVSTSSKCLPEICPEDPVSVSSSINSSELKSASLPTVPRKITGF